MRTFFFICVVAFSALSCVVADEIEFTDKVNYPPQFILADPTNDKINYAQNNDLIEFTVTVWEPDLDDFSLYDARISLIEQLGSSVQIVGTFSCDEPVLGEGEDLEEGAYISVTCAVTMYATNEAARNLLVMVEISDRGYGAGNVTPADARTLQVMWTYEILSQDAF